jgi:hypothetical protein
MMEMQTDVVNWLVESDPAIRWQVMRDILHSPPATYEAERSRLTREGWCAQLLGSQADDGLWNRSLYNGKWLSTTYSLYMLKLLGLHPGDPRALKGCEQLFSQGLYQDREIRFSRGQVISDLGVSALVLSISSYFTYDSPAIPHMVDYLVSQQSDEGSWLTNDDPSSMDYTFETTLLVLKALYQYKIRFSGKGIITITHAVRQGQEYLLNRHLGLEDGMPIKPQWTTFSFPAYWFYDILTALEYFYWFGKTKDKRLQPAIDLLLARQTRDGRWTLGSRHSGKTYFNMEEVGKASRWNTLRALRALTWWESD